MAEGGQPAELDKGIQVLVTSFSSNQVQASETRKVVEMFQQKGIHFTQIDGATNTDLRSAMW